jgi:hypothetical protein
MFYTKKTVKDVNAATKRTETVPDLTLPEDSVVVPVDGVALDPDPALKSKIFETQTRIDNVQLLLCDFAK